jgi:hypothetical protein
MNYPPFRLSKNFSDQLHINPPFIHPLLDSVLIAARFAIHGPKGNSASLMIRGIEKGKIPTFLVPTVLVAKLL